jgi:hypothetical protein
MAGSQPTLAGVTAQLDGKRPRLDPGVKLGDPSVQPQRLAVDRVLKPLQQTFQVSDSPFQGLNPRGVLISRIVRWAVIAGGGRAPHLANPGDEALPLGRSHLYVRRLG